MRTLIFSIDSVLFGLENTRGPIELVQFANRLASHEGIPWFNRMASIEFNSPNINKVLPGGVPTDNTLVIGQERGGYLDLYLCGYNVDVDPSAGHIDPSNELVSQSN
ncbi:hypothetical protein [Sphingobacterium sp. DR205]|uniref:hypothetical protein n=1 Tax=Sphingobacterium sp. DR205 TaxID=2713573 RepID=UPI0013E479AA|nr:hypothetical protein [Sphingobacterium sp. DR205]QIH35910.1 hypothetical protein G6053_24885 [Sphingobacterium sp. DR205]